MREALGDRVLGPDAPLVSRVQSMHIRKIILKMQLSDSITTTRQVLQSIAAKVLEQPIANSLRIYFDVDPQ